MITDAREFERSVNDAGFRIEDICKRAGKARSVFSRWKSGETSPSLRTVQAFNDALEAVRGKSKVIPQ